MFHTHCTFQRSAEGNFIWYVVFIVDFSTNDESPLHKDCTLNTGKLVRAMLTIEKKIPRSPLFAYEAPQISDVNLLDGYSYVKPATSKIKQLKQYIGMVY